MRMEYFTSQQILDAVEALVDFYRVRGHTWYHCEAVGEPWSEITAGEARLEIEEHLGLYDPPEGPARPRYHYETAYRTIKAHLAVYTRIHALAAR